MKISTRLAHAWNAFTAKDQDRNKWVYGNNYPTNLGIGTSYRADRTPLRIGTERSILASIYTRIAIDVAAIEIRHARVDINGRFQEEIKSNLNECLSISPNKDQTARMFFMDTVLSMFEEGTIAICPIDTTLDIRKSNSYDIQSMRVGKVTQWMPDHVRVEVYNDRTGIREELIFEKSKVCIIENPLYQVMNEPNSTLQRLRHKLALLDATDDKQNSDKLNMIIQLPYTIRSESRMQQAEERRKQVEFQLTDSKYGIAYIDGTEKIIQLGHPLENRLIEQIEYFTNQLYVEMGLTPEVFNGTATPQVMLNYNNRTVEPIVSAIVDEMNRKFLTKTARTQGQAIVFFRTPFSLATVENLAELADKFTRNEIMSSNEFRGILGLKPVDTQRADELINKNINPIDQFPQMGNNGMIPFNTDESVMSEDSEIDQNGNNSINGDNSLEPSSENVLDSAELESYLRKLEGFNIELEELERQANEA